jgi:hypothetical protein
MVKLFDVWDNYGVVCTGRPAAYALSFLRRHEINVSLQDLNDITITTKFKTPGLLDIKVIPINIGVKGTKC